MPFDKKVSERTPTEQTVINTAMDTLLKGDTLYGPDTTHIAWAMRLAILHLDEKSKLFDDLKMVVMLFKDDNGYGIAFLPAK